MRHLALFVLLAVLGAPVRAGEPMVVKIGATDIKISIPAGMVEMPKDETTAKALADITPPGSVLLRSCVSAEALDPTKPPDPMANFRHSYVLALKDVPQDIYSGDFIEFVQRAAGVAMHSVLMSQNSSFDYEETQKRLADFQKDTGVGMQEASDLYSLGMVSRSDACVSFMTAQYVNVTIDGKTQREKCISVEGYLLLKSKVVIAITDLTGPTILSSDLLTLKHAAEKYQIDLQLLNNQ